MHQIAPNCVSNFKKFSGVIPPDPLSLEGDTPSPDPFFAPRGICAVLNKPLNTLNIIILYDYLNKFLTNFS